MLNAFVGMDKVPAIKTLADNPFKQIVTDALIV
jgi:hypothetical protein